jgi:hypothetical protein
VERDARARQALSREASAFNWLEDSAWEEATHHELHRMGTTVHELFPDGCHLEWTDARYEHRCPVRIVHKRFGFSPSLRVRKKLCMICDGDASECPHLPNRLYPVVACRDDDGRCRICRESSCDHQPGIEYMTRMTVQITEIVAADEVSIVPRPVQPDARLIGVPIDTASLVAALGQDFTPGMEVHCSMCELPCDGVDRMPGDPRLEGEVLPAQKGFDEPAGPVVA